MASMTNKKNSKAQKPVPNFFMLPIELRNIIYGLILTVYAPPPLRKKGKKIYSRSSTKQTTFPLTLMQVFRHMGQEALPVFSGTNTFKLKLSCDDLDQWFEQFRLETLRGRTVPKEDVGLP